MLNVAVANLKKYNEGKLIYKWISLPNNNNEINDALKKIGVNGETDEEYIIVDHEFIGKVKFDIPEHSSVMTLNNIAELLQSLSEVELYAVRAYIELYGADIDSIHDAVEFAKSENFNILYDCYDMTDVAHYIINESGIYDLPDIAKTYFDYEAFGRDLSIESNFVFLDGGICVEVLN